MCTNPVVYPQKAPMPATTPSHAPLNKAHEATVVDMATEPVIVLDCEEGVATAQHESVDSHAILTSSM